MSGIKDVRVTMTRAERDRLVNNAQRAAESEHLARQRAQASQRALNAANSKLEVLNRTLGNEIAGLNNEIRQMADENNRRHREQIAENKRRLQEQAAAFNRSIDDVNRRMEHLRQQAKDNKRELQNSINQINARIEATEKEHRRIAEIWISQTQAYFDDISQYRHDMFTPGQLARLKTELDQMLSDMTSGMYQSATSTARSIFNRAVDLKEDVLCAENEWLYLHGLFVQTLANTQSNLNSYQNLQFTIAIEQGSETVDANINYWTDGALNIVNGEIEQIKQRAEGIDQVSTQELTQLVESLNQLNIQMEAAANEARDAIVSSKQRAEMANRLADALIPCGWGFKDKEKDGLAYENNDYNKPVHVKLSDGMGNEIAVVITPDKESQEMANSLEINFFDPKTNDEEQRQIWIASIQNSLKEGGINVGKPVCRQGYETKPSSKNELRDIQATASGSV